VDANGIAQVAPGAVGIHLSWSGPRSWVYAPAGWTVQRRPAGRLEARDCERLDDAAIAELRSVRETVLRFGVLTLRGGGWLDPLDGTGPNGATTPTDVFRVDLDEDHRMVRVGVTAKLSFVIALCEGRAVGVGGPTSGTTTHVLRAPRIDAVVAVTLDPSMLQVCVDAPSADDAEWKDIPAIVKGLTLPFRELMPGLGSEADELAEARRRLLPGEALDAEEFSRLAAVVRPGLRVVDPPRPSELVLLVREEPDGDADEVRALDPIRVLLAHPTWRRALGFGLFDDDPSLVPGEAYEYRLSATFPDEDVRDPNHGFATVPSGTLLPADFTLDGLRLRLPRPVAVGLTPGTPAAGAVRVTRRGIPLDPQREPFWLTPPLDDWSLVVDFPAPVDSVLLELAEGHDLVFAAGPANGPFLVTPPVPAGSGPRLVFGSPVAQLRLRGRGFLHALRGSTTDHDPVELSVMLPPILLADTPPPVAPLSASATSLQTAQPPPVDLVPAPDVAARHALGFRVSWRPSPAFGLAGWPADVEAAPPLDATIFQVERREQPSGPWTRVLGEDNWTLGDRDSAVRDLQLPPGTELMQAFPESASHPSGSDLDLFLVDAFGADAVGAPEPGAFVQYRVRSIDAVGRPSPNWTETPPVRLEKHLPPPLPVGPEAAAGDLAGVQARVLVRGASDLTATEQTLLGASDNAIVLRWGWHAAQRDQDPLSREFRVYAAPPMDVVGGQVLTVTTIGTGRVTSYQVVVQLDRTVRADVAAGLRLEAGHPFLIRSHAAGSTITMLVETRLRIRGAIPVPALGPVRLNLPLTPDRTRPPAWGPRVQIVPITDATTYQVVLRDRLTLSADQPADALWVGVSTADDQSYVADQLAPMDTRPGNESSIVPMLASGRFAGRPTLEIPPPLAEVPELRTPEPGAEPLHFPLDLIPFLPAGALSAERRRHERVAAGALLAACRATPDGRVLAQPVEPLEPGEWEAEILIPNPADRAELVAALQSGRSTDVDNRFLVYLAGHHPYRDRLFVAAHDEPLAPGPFAETLPPAADRWVYRIRSVDAAGHVSAGSATARVVVRVPSLLAGAPPVKAPRQPADPPERLRVRVPADATLSHLLFFHAPSVGPGPVEVTEVSRVPNRPDLLPDGGLWLRAPGGDLLAPTAIALDGPTVVVAADGSREIMLTVPGGPGERTRVWLATLTRDGIPSPLAGPYTLIQPVAV
jgi:hypothetical protein